MPERKLSQWEKLEEYLFDHNKAGTAFTVYEYAEDRELEMPEATRHIQSYLRAQRHTKGRTLYVLHRAAGTRTTKSRWKVGIRTRDARQVGAAFYDDVAAKVRRAFVPDLARIAMLNPRAAKAAQAQIDAVVEGAMKILEVAASGSPPGDGSNLPEGSALWGDQCLAVQNLRRFRMTACRGCGELHDTEGSA